MHVFESQQASDRVLEQLVVLLGCTDRSQLGVIASPRGLVAGNMVISHENAARIETVSGLSTLIPPEIVTQKGWHVQVPAGHLPKYVLLVEKETVFKTLVQLQQRPLIRDDQLIDLHESIVVTGRGYADQATRTLINLLANSFAPDRLRFVGLFDCDPYGIDIHRQYCQACPRANIQWLGVTLAHFLSDTAANTSSFIPLRIDERLKAVGLLRKMTSDPAEAQAFTATQDWMSVSILDLSLDAC